MRPNCPQCCTQGNLSYLLSFILLIHLYTGLITITVTTYHYPSHHPYAAATYVEGALPKMKFSIQQAALSQLVQTVSKAVAVRTPKPILSGILLQAETGRLTATAYDLELGIQDHVESAEDNALAVERPGAIVLPARYLSDVVRKLPQREIHITLQDNYMTEVQSGEAEFHLHGLDPSEFPKLPEILHARQTNLSASVLRRLISCTVFATANSEVRPVLTGIHLQLTSDRVTSTATDALRLATYTAQLPQLSDIQWDVILPAKSVNELAKILPEDSSLIPVQFTDTHSMFAVGTTLFYTRLIDGMYPDTTRIIPTNFKTHLILPTEELTDAIDRATLIARERDNSQVRFQLSDQWVLLSSSSAEIGNVSEQVGVIDRQGEDFNIAFNGRNVLDALRTMDTERVSIQFNGSNQPFILRAEGDENGLQLISPVLTR